MEAKQKKGGRPRLRMSEKKKYRVGLKMDTRDYYTLKAKAETAGMNMQELLRDSIHSLTIVARLQPEDLSFIRQLCGMANNLNQLAHKANADGYPSDAEKYHELADNVSQLLKQIHNVRKSND